MLRSTGPGLWAERWLFEQVPELRGLQAAVLQIQVQLIAITRAEPTTADPAREIVDGWAFHQGLSRWHAWKTP